MKRFYIILTLVASLCISCQWQLKLNDEDNDVAEIQLDRFDRIESLYLTTGDYSALQQMNTTYPIQTRMLIEDILCIGKVDTPDINAKLHSFFQDSTLQVMLSDVKRQYDEVDDLDEQLSVAFTRLKKELPAIEIPHIYTQVGSFDQSIIVGNNMLGISLDKYLGENYPFYLKNYTPQQRHMMVREMIVPDCLVFYLLSLYPVDQYSEAQPLERLQHMGRIQWIVNKVTGRMVFDNLYVHHTDSVVGSNLNLSIADLLSRQP